MKIKLKQLLVLMLMILPDTGYAINPTYESSITKFISDPSAKNTAELAGHLRGIANNNSPPESSPYYKKIQGLLMSIPGHARSLADDIKREQKQVSGIPTLTGARASYDRSRGWHFITLRHLPSPETIAVLGDFLSDDIDRPQPLLPPGSDWGENPRANSSFAAYTIHKIGLRDLPEPEGALSLHPDDLLASTRVWWAQVKSGQRTFSFKGQAVEYRFKLDGTWDTIPIANPPDDAPKIPEARPASAPPATQKAQEPPPGNAYKAIRTYLLAALAGLLALAAAWFGLRRTKAKT